MCGWNLNDSPFAFDFDLVGLFFGAGLRWHLGDLQLFMSYAKLDLQ